ncbi:hypothetical protein E8E14_002810 [Neopestalotiopsis sp. 37M]|nr:hypothetical protein E8E14_002810 [Neopestalotiopsis sp. 37M]
MGWHCFDPHEDQRPFVAETAEEFEFHLSTVHAGKFSSQEIFTITDISRQAIAPTIEHCPFCSNAPTTPESLEKHVSEHLQEFASHSLDIPKQITAPSEELTQSPPRPLSEALESRDPSLCESSDGSEARREEIIQCSIPEWNDSVRLAQDDESLPNDTSTNPNPQIAGSTSLRPISFKLPRKKTKELKEGPRILFGIDIGTSYTKVAYTQINETSNEESVPRVIQDWSELGGVANDTAYLPTVLAYRKGDSLLHDTPAHVGFLNEQQRRDNDLEIFEWFKESFPGNLRRGQDGGTRVQAANSDSTETMILYRHFLEKLYYAIQCYTTRTYRLNWNETRIDFMFSVPAMWNRVHDRLSTITQRFEKVAEEAGFGYNPVDSKLHKMSVTLTEPESAAVFSLQGENDLFRDGNSVMVVDAGGGTTDICLLKIKHAHRGQLSIDPLSAPTSEELGSAHIDRGFEQLAKRKLKELAYRLNIQWDTTRMSHAMRFSRDFQESKMELTMEKAMSNEYFTVAIPSINPLPAVSDLDDLLQRPDRLKLYWRELATIFDSVIDDRQVVKNGRPKTEAGIAKLVHRTRDHMIHQGMKGAPGSGSHGGKGLVKDVDIILLAGGLGQSSYLRDRIQLSLEDEQNPGASTPFVRTTRESQLCVSKGLLENRRFERFRARKCNANYGVLQDKALKLWKPLDLVATVANQYRDIGGKRYMRQVEWLVEKGKAIPDETPMCTHVFEGGEQYIVEIVVSHDSEPQRFTKPGDYIARIHCEDIALAQDKRGKPYCEVEVIFNIASFHVKCWSSKDPATRQLIGEYKTVFNEVAP